MADFALWAAACETALWPAGTFARAYGTVREPETTETITTPALRVSSGIH